MYDNQRDAAMRLDGTIVRLGGDVISISNVISDTTFEYTFLKTGKHDVAELNNPKLNVSPVTLGYVNLKGDAWYVSRIPARKWKQGLAESGYTVKGGRTPRREDIRPALVDCIDNVYPRYEQAVDMLQHGHDSVAFCRSFAVCNYRGGVSLMWKGVRVGLFKRGECTLTGEYKFLAEVLKEVLP